MPDLMPDTSIYQHTAQPQLDLGRLLATAGAARQLQSQSAISQALKSTVNPQTGQPDLNAALGALVKDPNVYIGPEDVAQFTHAQRAQSELGQWQMGQASSAMSSLLSDPNPTVEKFNQIAPHLKRYGVPSDMINGIIASATGRDGKIDKDKLVTLQQWAQGNAGLPTVPTIDPNTQQPVQKPVGQIMHEQAQGGAPGQPTSVGGVGGYPTAPPPFQASTQKEASDAQASMQHARSVDVPQNRMLLSNMLDLSREAATGPGANWQVNWSKLMTNLGMPQYATMTANQVASSENFKKISERLVNQMATSGGHITNDFLHNAYGSNPGLEISRQGREGMITWLQGITDSQNLVAKNWQGWLQNHPGQEGRFYDWASGKIPGGMNMSNFDMRVFQFERMNQDEQDKFLASMKGKGERETFLTHHRDYDKQGWLDSAQQ